MTQIPKDVQCKIDVEAPNIFERRITDIEGMASAARNATKKIFLTNIVNDLKRVQTEMSSLREIIKDREGKIEQLNTMLDQLSNGQAMNVVRTGEGQYTVVFNNNDDAKKYYEENDFENNL